VAARLAEGRMDRVLVLLTPQAAQDKEAVQRLFSKTLPRQPAYVRTMPGSGVHDLARATHAEAASMLVIGISDQTLNPVPLQVLRERIRCPICLVRRWSNKRKIARE